VWCGEAGKYHGRIVNVGMVATLVFSVENKENRD